MTKARTLREGAVDRRGQSGLSGRRTGQLLGDGTGNVDGDIADLAECAFLRRPDLLLGRSCLLGERSGELPLPLGGFDRETLGAFLDGRLRLGAGLGQRFLVSSNDRLSLGLDFGGAGEVVVEPLAPRRDDRVDPGQPELPHQQIENDKGDREPDELRQERRYVELRHGRSEDEEDQEGDGEAKKAGRFGQCEAEKRKGLDLTLCRGIAGDRVDQR
jgi:hypothetical protein